MTQSELDPERADDRLPHDLLAAYDVPAAAPDLFDRIAAAGAAERARRRRGGRAVAGGLGVLAAAAAIVLWLRPAAPPVSEGTLAATVRTQQALGARGVVVAEPGARLTWRIAGDARVAQTAGNVFYRVDPGGAFVVTTSAGDVTVHGTCFRVELEPGGGSGSPGSSDALAVTVYEGVVTIGNRFGQIEARAGDVVAATATTRPDRAGHGAAPTNVGSGLSSASLLARDQAQRERIAALERRVARLEVGTGSGAPAASEPARPRPFEMSRDQLVALAHACVVPVDVPPLAGSPVMEQLTELGYRKLHFDDAARAAVQRVQAKLQPAYTAELQALYREQTGEDTTLEPLSLILELSQKSRPEDVVAAHRRVADERAGLRPPPSDPRTGSVIERYLRQAIVAGDTYERELATELGSSRAREFRRTWGMVNLQSGCPVESTP